MCGIAGIVGEKADRGAVERMTERLRHRGPDDGGVQPLPGAVLGHRRLSILDLSTAGRQPMTLGDWTLVYNGEIYNYRELRADLPGPFVSSSDTEILLHLIARDGLRCLDRVRGMFAFAAWNSRTRTLLAARDRLGIKPFYYLDLPGAFAFASELKALRELGTRPIDRAALADFFTYKYVPAPRSIYAGIRKLPPGHTLTFDGALRIERYWSPKADVVRKDPEAAAGELRELLRDCVVSHTVSDVPVGVFLSGGVDSSSVVAHLDRPKTFSIGFDVEEHSELPYARLVAERFNTDHAEETVQVGDLEQSVAAIPEIFDEPFGDSSGWATYAVSRAARRKVTVALSGEGGDETFSGYTWYGKWLDGASPFSRLASLLPPFAKMARRLEQRDVDGIRRYGALIGLFTPAQQRKLLAKGLSEENPDPYWYLRANWREDLDPIKRMQWADLHTYLPDDLLVKVDRASMAVSLEVRPPLLDHRLVEFSLSLDSSMLRRDMKGKLLLRKIVEGVLPSEILTRPKKGFSMPVRRWSERRPELLRNALKRLAESGILRSPKQYRFSGEQIWSLLVLDRWMHR